MSLAESLQVQHDLTCGGSCKNKGFPHQEVYNNQRSFTLLLEMLC